MLDVTITKAFKGKAFGEKSTPQETKQFYIFL